MRALDGIAEPDLVPIGKVAEGEETVRSGDSVPAEGYPARTSAEPEKQRVHLEGIVGRKPTYYQTRRGMPVARFSVGEKPEAGQPHWHAVVAFKKWAHFVRDNVQKRRPR